MTTRIKNNQITDSTITAQKIASGTLTGSLFAPDLTLSSNVTISGNLSVAGTTSTVQSTNTYINDPLVVFNNGYTGTPTYDIGILVNRNLANLGGSNVNTAFVWDESGAQFVAITTTETGTTTGDITITSYADMQAGAMTVSSLTDGTLTINSGAITGIQSLTADSITATTGVTGDVTGNLTGNVAGNVTGNITSSGTSTFTTVDVNGGAIDGTVIGGTTPAAGSFTTLSASTSITGNLTGNVTGDLTGTADDANAVNLTATNTTDASHFIMFAEAATGTEEIRTDTGLTFNPSTDTLTATTFSGALSGNATTASTWANARTVTLAGDLSGSVSIDGSTNVTLTATIAADSIALGTDTTGNYVASITNGSYITGGDGGSESAALTLAVDATDQNTASKVVARDANGDFAAGTITADLTGDVTGDLTGNVTSSGTSSFADITISGDLTGNSAGAAGSDILWSGDTVAGLFRVVASATYDTVIIGGDGTAGDLVTDSRLTVVGTDSMIIPKGTTGERPGTGVQGMLRYNSTNGSAEVYTGATWKNLSGDFTIITADSFNGDDSTTAFTLSESTTTAATMISINGVVQIPTSAYSVSGTTLTFTEAPATGDVIDARIITTTSSLDGLSSGNGYMKIEPTNSALNIYTGTSSGTITSYYDSDGAFVESKTGVSVGTSATTVVSFAAATYRTAKFVVQATNGTDYQSDEILVIHDGTTATMTQYAQTVADGTTAFMTYSVTISGGNVLLQGTGSSGTSTVRAAKHYIVV